MFRPFAALLLSLTVICATLAAAPTASAAESPIQAKYRELGGAQSFLGSPTSNEFCGLRDGGCAQRFRGGTIFWSAGSGAYFARGDILKHYGANHYEVGFLGYPLSDEECWLRGGGCFQLFQGGSIYWLPGTGAHFVRGAILERWTWWQEGYGVGDLGYPTSIEFCGLRAGGCFQRFQGGSIYWSPTTGAHIVLGAIRDRWGQMGWESLRTPSAPTDITQEMTWDWGRDLGYPTSDEICGLMRGGCFQNFERGRIYWSPATGAHPVTPGKPGANGGYWTAMGAERSRYGYPVNAEMCSGYPESEWGCYQRFENGAELADYPGHFDENGNPIWAW